jgi:hypothetical protein
VEGLVHLNARRTSPDGPAWSPPEVIIQPDWLDPHDQQFMELTPMKARGGYVGLLSCYNVREHTVDFQLAGSADGRLWSRPSRRPTLPVSPLGDYGGGMLWPTHEFIEHEGHGSFVTLMLSLNLLCCDEHRLL